MPFTNPTSIDCVLQRAHDELRRSEALNWNATDEKLSDAVKGLVDNLEVYLAKCGVVLPPASDPVLQGPLDEGQSSRRSDKENTAATEDWQGLATPTEGDANPPSTRGGHSERTSVHIVPHLSPGAVSVNSGVSGGNGGGSGGVDGAAGSQTALLSLVQLSQSNSTTIPPTQTNSAVMQPAGSTGGSFDVQTLSLSSGDAALSPPHVAAAAATAGTANATNGGLVGTQQRGGRATGSAPISQFSVPAALVIPPTTSCDDAVAASSADVVSHTPYGAWEDFGSYLQSITDSRANSTRVSAQGLAGFPDEHGFSLPYVLDTAGQVPPAVVSKNAAAGAATPAPARAMGRNSSIGGVDPALFHVVPPTVPPAALYNAGGYDVHGRHLATAGSAMGAAANAARVLTVASSATEAMAAAGTAIGSRGDEAFQPKSLHGLAAAPHPRPEGRRDGVPRMASLRQPFAPVDYVPTPPTAARLHQTIQCAAPVPMPILSNGGPQRHTASVSPESIMGSVEKFELMHRIRAVLGRGDDKVTSSVVPSGSDAQESEEATGLRPVLKAWGSSEGGDGDEGVVHWVPKVTYSLHREAYHNSHQGSNSYSHAGAGPVEPPPRPSTRPEDLWPIRLSPGNSPVAAGRETSSHSTAVLAPGDVRRGRRGGGTSWSTRFSTPTYIGETMAPSFTSTATRFISHTTQMPTMMTATNTPILHRVAAISPIAFAPSISLEPQNAAALLMNEEGISAMNENSTAQPPSPLPSSSLATSSSVAAVMGATTAMTLTIAAAMVPTPSAKSLKKQLIQRMKTVLNEGDDDNGVSASAAVMAAAAVMAEGQHSQGM